MARMQDWQTQQLRHYRRKLEARNRFEPVEPWVYGSHRDSWAFLLQLVWRRTRQRRSARVAQAQREAEAEQEWVAGQGGSTIGATAT